MTGIHTSRVHLPTIAAVIAAAIGAGAAARAADSTPAVQSPELAEVVVTAQKRVERLQDVPTAITVLDASKLVETNALSLDDYFRAVPGLTLYDNGDGFQKLVMRGITTGDGETPTVGIYVDDTPIGGSTQLSQSDSLVPDIDPSDLQRIEVLKGPQGTLYGAGAMGGLFKYVTVAPDPNTFSGRVGVDGESIDGGGTGGAVRGAVNLPLIADTLAVRISASTRNDPGFIKNINGDENNVNSHRVNNGRVALLWNATDAVSVELTAMLQDSEGHGLDREDYNFVTRQPTYGDLEQSRVPNTDAITVRDDIFNLKIKDDFGWATLTSSSSYSTNKFDGPIDLSYLFSSIFGPAFGIPDLGIKLTQKFGTDKISQEVRMVSEGDRNVDWIAGFFYTNEHSRYYQNFDPIQTGNGQEITGLPLFSEQYTTSNYQEFAGFGGVTYHFTKAFDTQVGVRYAYNNQDDNNSVNGFFNGGPPAIGNSGESHQGAFTFMITPEYKFNDDQMAYGRIASGYRPGGPNYTFITGFQPPYQSDTLINYEVGFKSDFLNRTAYFDLAAYYITWKHIQLEGENADDALYFSNAGSAVSRGFEASGQYRPIRALTLGGNLTFTDAHLTANAPNGIYAPAGSQLPYSPRISGQVSADYEVPLTTFWKGGVGGDYSYFGARVSDFQADASIPRPELPAYRVLNLHTGVHDDRYSVNLFVKNVANERGINDAIALSLGKALDQYSVSLIQPRTVGLSLAAKF
jgi:iron complex outermembrane recepter protein